MLKQASDGFEALQTRIATAEGIIQTQFSQFEARMKAHEENPIFRRGNEEFSIGSPLSAPTAGAAQDAADQPKRPFVTADGRVAEPVPVRPVGVASQLPPNVHTFNNTTEPHSTT